VRFLSQEERIEIADLHHAGVSIRQIAARIGRAPSTVSRELRRNGRNDGGYRPFEAHRKATSRRARHHQRRLEKNPELASLIDELSSASREATPSTFSKRQHPNGLVS
jgi:IS30 family transposase